MPEISAPNPIELLSWPGVTEQIQLDQTELVKNAKQLFEQAVNAMIENRKIEGERMRQLIAQRSDQLKELYIFINELYPAT